MSLVPLGAELSGSPLPGADPVPLTPKLTAICGGHHHPQLTDGKLSLRDAGSVPQGRGAAADCRVVAGAGRGWVVDSLRAQVGRGASVGGGGGSRAPRHCGGCPGGRWVGEGCGPRGMGVGWGKQAVWGLHGPLLSLLLPPEGPRLGEPCSYRGHPSLLGLQGSGGRIRPGSYLLEICLLL